MEHIAIRWVFLGMSVLPTTMSSRSLTDTLDPSLIFVSRTNMHSKGYCVSVGTVRSSSARELKPPPWASSRDDMAEVLRTGASSPMTAMGCPCGAAGCSPRAAAAAALLMLSFCASPVLTAASVFS